MDTKPIRRLVAKEFEVEEGDLNPVTFPIGWKYIYFEDPKTGKLYEPKPGWEVIGEDLTNRFQEVSIV